MSTPVARQIHARLKAKNMTILDLEKKARLGAHAVRNIVRGNTKKPAAEVLQAIADVFGCTVRDLLADEGGMFDKAEPLEANALLLDSPYQHHRLLEETVKAVNGKIREGKQAPTIQQALSAIQETYLHSLQKDPERVDESFVKWFMELMAE